MKLLPRILPDEDEEDRRLDAEEPRDQPEPAADPQRSTPNWRWPAAVAALAAIPRLLYLFVFSDPENAGHGFTDAYHHWQIAYLTKEIGLSHGPRLWDMRGWEYYWGLLHPALLNLLFFASGSDDIVVARLLSLVFGSLAVALIFLLCHRYWGTRVAVASALFAALQPAGVFNDDAGMAEPVAIALVLLGIWLSSRHGFWGGVSWGLAAMARVEAWLFAAGLVVAWVWRRRHGQAWLAVVVGWALVMAFYAKFLFDQTGNPIYPFYWSFLFVAFGTFESGPLAISGLEFLRIPLAAATVASFAGLAWSLWKRPPSYLLLVYGFGASAYAFATFLKVDDWRERRFEFPLDFAAILVAVFLFRVLPQHRPRMRALPVAAAAAGLLAMQVFWIPIQGAYSITEAGYREQVRFGQTIGSVYNRPEFRDGRLSLPGDAPTLTYTMVRYGRVPGAHITSQFYDPFYYLPGHYHYADHKDVVGPLLQCWLAGTDTRLMVIAPYSSFNHSVPEYEAFIADHPDWFGDTGVHLDNGWKMIAVRVPALSQSECAAATRSAPH